MLTKPTEERNGEMSFRNRFDEGTKVKCYQCDEVCLDLKEDPYGYLLCDLCLEQNRDEGVYAKMD